MGTQVFGAMQRLETPGVNKKHSAPVAAEVAVSWAHRHRCSGCANSRLQDRVAPSGRATRGPDSPRLRKKKPRGGAYPLQFLVNQAEHERPRCTLHKETFG